MRATWFKKCVCESSRRLLLAKIHNIIFIILENVSPPVYCYTLRADLKKKKNALLHLLPVYSLTFFFSLSQTLCWCFHCWFTWSLYLSVSCFLSVRVPHTHRLMFNYHLDSITYMPIHTNTLTHICASTALTGSVGAQSTWEYSLCK